MEGFCQVFDTGDAQRGRGVRARIPIERSTIIGRYEGVRLNKEQGEAREGALGGGVPCYMFWFVWRSRWHCVDATDSTHMSRFINHSRRHHNVRPKLVVQDFEPVIVFVTTRRIEEGEEILFDYGDRRRDVISSNPWLKE